MNYRLALCSVVLCALALPVRAETPEDILALAQKNIGEDVLLATVENAKSAFTLNAADIIKLKEAKVPDKVIAAMIRHRPAARAGDVAAAQPKAIPPAAPAAPAPAVNGKPARDAAGEGTLNIENVDTRTWSYMYEPDAGTLWISGASADGRGNLAANAGVSLRMPAGTYKVRYNGQSAGPAVTVHAAEKSLLMITRIENDELEALYVSVFENGERRTGGRLVVLRENPAPPRARVSQKAEANDREVAEERITEVRPRERIIERERVVEVPSTTVIYRDAYYAPPPVIYTSPVYCGPRYHYAPRSYCGPSYGGDSSFGYSRHGSRSGYSVGFGFGF